MFGYPLPVPRHTQYSAMGIDPEATTEEIREATEEIVISLRRNKGDVDRHIEEVYASVQGLREAYEQTKALQAQGAHADLQALHSAKNKLAKLEQKAEMINSNFKGLRERSADLELRIHEINRTALANPEARLAYDRANPPLELLKLGKCTRDEFTETKTALVLLRRELSKFLAAQGEQVFHPSDLTREDFSADFMFNPILDGPKP